MLNEESFEWDITADNLTGTLVLQVSFVRAYNIRWIVSALGVLVSLEVLCHVVDGFIRNRSIWHLSSFQNGYLEGL